MTDFSERLKRSLTGVNAAFDAADADLHAVIAEAARGVQENTNGKATLALDVKKDDDRGTVYALVLDTRDDKQELVRITVQRGGYPILFTSESLESSRGVKVTNRTELEEEVTAMASNPDSPLVVKLAFLMRKERVS